MFENMKHVWQRNMIFLEGEFSMGCPILCIRTPPLLLWAMKWGMLLGLKLKAFSDWLTTVTTGFMFAYPFLLDWHLLLEVWGPHSVDMLPRSIDMGIYYRPQRATSRELYPQLGLIRQLTPKYIKKNQKFIDKVEQSVYIGVFSRVLSSKMAFILCSNLSFIVFWPDFCLR